MKESYTPGVNVVAIQKGKVVYKIAATYDKVMKVVDKMRRKYPGCVCSIEDPNGSIIKVIREMTEADRSFLEGFTGSGSVGGFRAGPVAHASTSWQDAEEPKKKSARKSGKVVRDITAYLNLTQSPARGRRINLHGTTRSFAS